MDQQSGGDMTALITLLRSPLAKYIGVALTVIALLAGLIWWATRAQDKAIEQSRDAGAAIQRAEDLHQSIETIERAKDAQEAIRIDNAAAHAGCLRYSRTPENCK